MYSQFKPSFSGDPDFAKAPKDPLTDAQAVDLIKNWMVKDLPCVAGRRETLRNRYMVETASRRTVPRLFADYKSRLRAGNAVACLYVFNSADYASHSKTVSDVFYFLAREMQLISNVSPYDLANGHALTQEITLECPVTGIETVYDDFECIAFCPQSNNPSDPLYDPLMAMPLPCVNMSSDMFAFSNFVADMIHQRYKMHPVDLSQDQTEMENALFHCVTQWQRIATKTIQNYESITDTSICPIHLNPEQDHWIAGHKDPAFAEQIKEPHAHELPILYGTRIVEQWLDFFYNDRAFSAAGLARDGVSHNGSTNHSP